MKTKGATHYEAAQVSETAGSRRPRSPNKAIKHARKDVDVVRMARIEAENRRAERHSMVAAAAYFRAEKRGFTPGHELDDWLAAEQEVAGRQASLTLSGSS